MSIPRSRLALKAKIRKDFAFKIEIRNLRKARRREGMRVDGLPLVVGDKGGGGTGLRLRIWRDLRGYGRSGEWRRIWKRDSVARYLYPATVASPVASLAIALEHALQAHWGRPEPPRGLVRTA